MMPRFRPMVTAWARSLAPSLDKILGNAALHGRFVIESSSAICLFPLPASFLERRFPFRQSIVDSMISQRGATSGGIRLFSGMHRADVSSSSSRTCPLSTKALAPALRARNHLGVSGIGSSPQSAACMPERGESPPDVRGPRLADMHRRCSDAREIDVLRMIAGNEINRLPMAFDQRSDREEPRY